MAVFFVGAMSWVQLFRDGERTGWASVIQADWSPHGPGRFITLRRDGRLRISGDNQSLIDWLLGLVSGAGGGGVRRVLAAGAVRARGRGGVDRPRPGAGGPGGGIEFEISEPFDRQLIHRSPYPLGEFRPTTSWVRVCCATARIVVDGVPIEGDPVHGADSVGPRSSAQINVAEVWTT